MDFVPLQLIETELLSDLYVCAYRITSRYIQFHGSWKRQKRSRGQKLTNIERDLEGEGGGPETTSAHLTPHTPLLFVCYL